MSFCNILGISERWREMTLAKSTRVVQGWSKALHGDCEDFCGVWRGRLLSKTLFGGRKSAAACAGGDTDDGAPHDLVDLYCLPLCNGWDGSRFRTAISQGSQHILVTFHLAHGRPLSVYRALLDLFL